MEETHGATQPVKPNGDPHGTKRALQDENEPDVKRVKVDGNNDVQNGSVQNGSAETELKIQNDSTATGVATAESDEPKATSEANAEASESKSKSERQAEQSETNGLPKGSAPIKKE